MGIATLAAANLKIVHDKDENLARFLATVDEAVTSGVDLLVLPEMGLQGYADFAFKMGTREGAEQRRYFGSVAETIPGPSTDRLQRELRNTDLHVQLGLAERSLHGNLIFNSTVLLGPDGVVGVYRKIHNQFEYPYFAPGGETPLFDLPFGRVGMLICYDIAFPELVRTFALKGADIALLSTAWPMKGHSRNEDHHGWAMDLAIQANAFFNQIWIVASNHCETGAYSQKVDYYGNSQIVDPFGKVVESRSAEEGLVIHEADIDREIWKARTESVFGHNFLQDRRPEHYNLVSDAGVYGHSPSPARLRPHRRTERKLP